MVLGRVDGVDANHVCEDLLQVGDVAATGVTVGKRIRVCSVCAGGAVWRVVLLVRDTLEIAGVCC